MRTCANCGAPEQAGALCTSCGAALGWPAPTVGPESSETGAWAPPPPPSKSSTRPALIVALALGVFVLAGVVAFALTRKSPDDVLSRVSVGGTGPLIRDHWHAALGVYVCDQWTTGTEPDLLTGEEPPLGAWAWPELTSSGAPARVGTDEYAGLHSHNDGIVHMEPVVLDETGNDATLGRYFEFGGWSLGPDHIDFLDEDVRPGDVCNGEPASVRWSVNGRVQPGDPAAYKLFDGDVIVVAFVPRTTDLDGLGPPPSAARMSTPESTPTTVDSF